MGLGTWGRSEGREQEKEGAGEKKWNKKKKSTTELINER